MINISLKELSNQDKWIVKHIGEDCIYVRGYLFHNNKLFKGDALINLVKYLDYHKLFLLAQKANGFFAIIKKHRNKIIVVTDRIRSISIFYGKKNNEIFLSDNPCWILEKLEIKKINLRSKKEFLALGYVTGPDTLYENIKQLQAGEILNLECDNKEIEIRAERYYRYLHSIDLKEGFNILLEKLNEAINNTFSRLIRILDGRPAVIPLSGGYDSRLIATMLKKFKYDNVICFSYGKLGNLESTRSQELAKNLGFRWEFIPYSNEEWYSWYRTKEMAEYIKFASGFSSVAHIQDWPAVWKLKKNRTVPENSVFVPGHSADFIAGSHITDIYNSYGKIRGKRKLIKAVLDYHYNLYKWPKKDLNIFEEKISGLLSGFNIDTFEDLLNAFEYWDWQERQAKLIVNSVRVYEFWGYDWLIPLWDFELMDFFSRLPLDFRLNKVLYETYVKREYEKAIEIDEIYASTLNENIVYSKKKYLRSNIKGIIIYLRLLRFYKKIIEIIKAMTYKRKYETHPLCWYGINKIDKFKEFYTGREHINSFLAKMLIDKIDK